MVCQYLVDLVYWAAMLTINLVIPRQAQKSCSNSSHPLIYPICTPDISIHRVESKRCARKYQPLVFPMGFYSRAMDRSQSLEMPNSFEFALSVLSQQTLLCLDEDVIRPWLGTMMDSKAELPDYV